MSTRKRNREAAVEAAAVVEENGKQIKLPDIVECGICADDLNNGEEIKKLLPNCEHEFHTKCINGWINSGITNTNREKCPYCRAPINQAIINQARHQQPMQAIQPIQQSTIQIRHSLLFPNNTETNKPFLGILICLNGTILKKYLNTDFGLRPNSTIQQLKDAIISRSAEISQQRGYFCLTNLGRDINNSVAAYTGIGRQREARFGITSIDFGVPDSCQPIPGLTSDFNLNNSNNTTLSEIYRMYQYQAENILYQHRINRNYLVMISKVYNEYVQQWLQTGPDDPGQAETNYFVNDANPDIPDQFRPVTAQYNPKATELSLGWLIVNIRCATFDGGKTKKRCKKGKKSIKKRCKKGKKSIKKR